MELNLLQEKLKSIADLEFIGLKFIHDFKKEYKNQNIFYIIGNDYEAKIGIKEEDREVFSISEEEIVFMNSSLENLIDCIISMKLLILMKNMMKKREEKILK
jgi:hypothetical protein